MGCRHCIPDRDGEYVPIFENEHERHVIEGMDEDGGAHLRTDFFWFPNGKRELFDSAYLWIPYCPMCGAEL